MSSVFEILEALLPIKWLAYFEIKEIKKKPREWQIILIEKEECFPEQLKDKRPVRNGFLNPVEVRDFPIRGKPTFLKFYRRRWKIAGKTEDYFNTYDFHPKGMKATEEFGNFLKDLDREAANFLRGDWDVP